MIYNVSQILMEPIGSTRRFLIDDSISVPDSAEGVSGQALGVEGTSETSHVTGAVRVLRTHQGLLINAEVEVQVASSCARCLTPCDRLSELALEEECYPTVDPATGRYMRPPDESEGVLHVDTRQMLDLSDVLRQYLLTDEPLKVLCREDCLGLCPECGADLNTEKCKCDAPDIDPRWGALAALIGEDPDTSAT